MLHLLLNDTLLKLKGLVKMELPLLKKKLQKKSKEGRTIVIFFLTCRKIDGSLCSGREEDMVLLPTNDQHAKQQFIFLQH